MTERDEDALWRSIVENYGDRIDLDPSAEPTPEPSPLIPADAPTGGVADQQAEVWDDPADHFVPPEPPPLPRPEPPTLLAWAGVLGVPLLTVVLTVFALSVPSWLTLLAWAWFVGGFGFLVATMRRGDDDEWDDGARL